MPFDPATRVQHLRKFEEEFESLVETLCHSAQYVPSSDLDMRYRQASSQVRRTYAKVCAYLAVYYPAGSHDPVLFLTHAQTMDEWLLMDNGSMIACIERARDAVRLYRRHLEVLGGGR